MNIKKLLQKDINQIVISIILGLGLAALFRKACSDKKCLIIEGPPLKETEKYYYKINDNCYKYTPVVSECD